MTDEKELAVALILNTNLTNTKLFFVNLSLYYRVKKK